MPHSAEVARGAIAVVFMVSVFCLFLHGVALPQTNPNCTEFGFQISTNCCCSANCCSEAGEDEFRHVGENLYRSTVTGQVIKRTGWSPDGRTIKCACTQIEGTWTKRPDSLVRCLFMPQPSS